MSGKINHKNGQRSGNKIRITVIIGLIFFMAGCAQPETDLQFTRRVFNGLCSGERRVESSIDWENFRAMGIDVGQDYAHLATEKERRDYRKLFLNGFTYTFKVSGIRASVFTNWRAQSTDVNNAIMAADTPSGKVLLFVISYKDIERKLVAINWRE